MSGCQSVWLATIAACVASRVIGAMRPMSCSSSATTRLSHSKRPLKVTTSIRPARPAADEVQRHAAQAAYVVGPHSSRGAFRRRRGFDEQRTSACSVNDTKQRHARRVVQQRWFSLRLIPQEIHELGEFPALHCSDSTCSHRPREVVFVDGSVLWGLPGGVAPPPSGEGRSVRRARVGREEYERGSRGREGPVVSASRGSSGGPIRRGGGRDRVQAPRWVACSHVGWSASCAGAARAPS